MKTLDIIPSLAQLATSNKEVTLVDISNEPNHSGKSNNRYTDTGESDKGTVIQRGKDFLFKYMDGKLLDLKHYVHEVEGIFSGYLITVTSAKGVSN